MMEILFEAITVNNHQQVQHLIDKNVNIYKPSHKYLTPVSPLHKALEQEGRHETADIILKCYERDINRFKLTKPVYIACGEEQIKLINNIRVNASQGTNFSESVVLYRGKHSEIVEVDFKEECSDLKTEVLTNGVLDANYTCLKEQTYLHLAILRGYVDIFKRLLNLKADYTLKNKHGDTCLHVAASVGQLEILNQLLELPNIDLFAKNKDNTSVLAIAAQSDDVKIFDAIFKKTLEFEMNIERVTKRILQQNETLLRINVGYKIEMLEHIMTLHDEVINNYMYIIFATAVKHNRYILVRNLIDRGANVFELLLASQEYAIYIASEHGSTEAFLEIVKEYPENAFRDNLYDCVRSFHKAIRHGSNRIVEAMLNLGVDPEKQDGSWGLTALHDAARWNNMEVLNMLIVRGVNLEAVNGRNQTALDIARNSGQQEIVKTLEEHVVRITSRIQKS